MGGRKKEKSMANVCGGCGGDFVPRMLLRPKTTSKFARAVSLVLRKKGL
jgi:hypothetical protein